MSRRPGLAFANYSIAARYASAHHEKLEFLLGLPIRPTGLRACELLGRDREHATAELRNGALALADRQKHSTAIQVTGTK